QDLRGLAELEEAGRDVVAPRHLGVEALLHVDQDDHGLVAAEQARVHQYPARSGSIAPAFAPEPLAAALAPSKLYFTSMNFERNLLSSALMLLPSMRHSLKKRAISAISASFMPQWVISWTPRRRPDGFMTALGSSCGSRL